MTTAQVPVHLSSRLGPSCLGPCAGAGRHPAHHDRLLAVDTDVDALLELLEMALTWHELDYSETSVIRPERWSRFRQDHVWRRPEVAERAFRLAEDIVERRGEVRCGPGRLAEVVRLVVD